MLGSNNTMVESLGLISDVRGPGEAHDGNLLVVSESLMYMTVLCPLSARLKARRWRGLV